MDSLRLRVFGGAGGMGHPKYGILLLNACTKKTIYALLSLLTLSV